MNILILILVVLPEAKLCSGRLPSRQTDFIISLSSSYLVDFGQLSDKPIRRLFIGQAFVDDTQYQIWQLVLSFSIYNVVRTKVHRLRMSAPNISMLVCGFSHVMCSDTICFEYFDLYVEEQNMTVYWIWI